ncbi:MAG: DUF2079 domain-containing protein [Chloroflexi bacterium]|nr:DUF2079 domain-containing protein [Chloroflexota bacterium]
MWARWNAAVRRLGKAAVERARRAWVVLVGAERPGDHLAGVLTLLAVAVIGTIIGSLAVLRYLSHHAEAFDMGIEDQMMWSTLHGRFFGVTLERRLTTTYLGYHVEPISLIGPLLYLVYPSPISLIVFKNVVIALGALPAFWLARRRLASPWAGLVFALVYLLFPGLEAAQLYDFHAYTLTAPLLLAAFCCLEARRYGWLGACLVLAAATKENAPLDAVPLGLYLIAARRRILLGAGLAVGGLAWFAVASYVIVPHFNAEGQAWLWTRYGGMGGSPLGAVRYLLANPRMLVAPVPDDPNWHYLFLLLAPVAWLPLLSPTALFLMLPALAVNVLTTYEPMHLIETYHYSAHLVPYVVLGAVNAIGTLAALAGRLRLPRAVGVGIPCAAVLAATLVYHHYRGYTPLSGEFVGYEVTAHDRLGDRLAAEVGRLVPLEAPISAQSNLYPHVDHRPDITMFPGVGNARLVFLDVATLPNTTGINEGIHDAVRRLLDSGQFGVVAAEDGYLILMRGAPVRPLPDAFYSFARAGSPRITHPLDVLFGDRLELLGFDVLPGRDGTVNLRVYWRARAKIPQDYFLTFYITDGRGHERGAALHREPANEWYRTPLWRPGEIVQVTTYNLPIGRRGQDFGIALGAQLAPDPWDTVTRLRPVVRSAPAPLRTPGQGTLLEVITFHNDHDLLTPEVAPRHTAPPAHRLAAQFDAGITLEGYTLTTAPGVLNLDLVWRASGATPIPYTVFVHLLDREGRIIAQHDSPPDGGLKATTAWLAGEEISDRHAIALPPGLDLAGARLEVGLYDPATGRRLRARVGDAVTDHVQIDHLAPDPAGQPPAGSPDA